MDSEMGKIVEIESFQLGFQINGLNCPAVCECGDILELTRRGSTSSPYDKNDKPLRN